MSGFSRDFYVSSSAGSDVYGEGTEQAPYKTLKAVRKRLSGGDSVILQQGSYASFVVDRGPSDIFNDWVTIKSFPGHKVSIESIRLGRRHNRYMVPYSGTYNAYLKIQDLDILDGIGLYGANHVEIKNCRVTKHGPWTGSNENMRKTAIEVRGGSHIVIEECVVTDSAIGIAVRANNIDLINNHVFRLTHDGIRITGCVKARIIGNRLHNFDDGVDDEPNPPSWNRHADALHIFMEEDSPSAINDDILIRGNLLYDSESQGVQFNNYGDRQYVNKNIVVENNIFGPTVAPLFHNTEGEVVESMIFRHNTIVFFPEGRSFKSRFRTLYCNNYHVDFSSRTRPLEVYNNIFVNRPYIPVTALRAGYNLYIGTQLPSAISRTAVKTNVPQFRDPASFDGILIETSPAINGGTRLDQEGKPIKKYIEEDYYSNPRDARPDIGAVEHTAYSYGADPEESPVRAGANADFRNFIDDFADLDFNADRMLVTGDTAGLSWIQYYADPSHHRKQYSFDNAGRLSGNFLSGPRYPGEYLLSAKEGRSWEDYSFSFTAYTGLEYGGGPVFLMTAVDSFYWVDAGTRSGRLIRVVDGRQTVLSKVPALALQKAVETRYTIIVKHVPKGVRLEIKNGSASYTYTDTSPEAQHMFKAGTIGFYRNTSLSNHRIEVDDIHVIVGKKKTSPSLQ